MKLSAPAAPYNFVSSSDLECVYQSTGRCGRVANPLSIPAGTRTPLRFYPIRKAVLPKPLPHDDRKSGVLDDREKRARQIQGSYGGYRSCQDKLFGLWKRFRRACERTDRKSSVQRRFIRISNRLTFCQVTEILNLIMKLKSLIFSNFK